MSNLTSIPVFITARYKAIKATHKSYTRQTWAAIEQRNAELLSSAKYWRWDAMELIETFTQSSMIRTDRIRRFKV